jgi:hypothetical protein
MSEVIHKAGTYDTPTIKFDPGKGSFNMSGRSLPVNTFEFYQPILDAVTEYLENPLEESTFEFKMDFINSSSTKVLLEMFHQIQKAHKKGKKVQVNWYYKFGDEDMKELGDDLRMDISFPFEFIAYE